MPLLGCRFLLSLANVNSYRPAERLTFYEGDSATIYLQLVDQNTGEAECGQPPFRRYVPAAGSALRVTLRNLDSAIQATKVATQPFPGDASIWSFAVIPSDQLRGTVSLGLDLLESGLHLHSSVQPAISVRAKGAT